MQLRHVEYFVTTAETGTVSAAARALHVTQPALSRQLRQLETDLGVALFDREAGRLRPSRAGRALLPAARELLAAADRLEAGAAVQARGRVERVTIAAPTVTLTDVVAPFVATMSPDDPVVDVRPADASDPAEALRAGADLVIGTHRPPAPFRSRPLAVLPVWAYVRGDHPWAARRSVTLVELLGEQLVLLPPHFTAREALDAAVGAAGASYAAVVEAANGTVAQALAASGRGVAVVSDDPRHGLAPLAVDLGERPLSIRLVAAWDPRGPGATTLEGLARRLGGYAAERYGAEHGGAATSR